MRILTACLVLAASVVFAACGDDSSTTTVSETTTTVTTAESEAAAEGTTTTPDGQVVATAEADSGSDAATAIPGDQDAVVGAQPEDATAQSTTAPTTSSGAPQGGVNGVVGENPNGGVATSATSTTTVDPVTGEPVAPVSPTTTTTTTDPDTGEVVTTESASTAETTSTVGADGTTTTTSGAASTTTPSTSLPPSDFGTTTTPLGSGATLGRDEGILSRPFSPDSPWNTPIAGNKVDKNSNQWIRQSRIRVAEAIDNQASLDFSVRDRTPDSLKNGTRGCGGGRGSTALEGAEPQKSNCRTINAGLTINVTKWTDYVFSNAQEGSVRRIAICRQFNCGPDAVSSIVIPADACPDPRYDGWMTVIDNTTRTALDFWRARCENDGSISYHYVKKWDLDGPGFQMPNGVSARGSGLPLFAGLITPEEISDGTIDHALAISVPGAATRRYVQPASRTDGTGLVTSLPEGARLRLKPGAEKLITKRFARNKTQRRNARAIIEALQRYGAFVVDRSAAPTLYAQRNANWKNILPLNLIQDIGLDRFEVVQAGKTFFDPPRLGEGTFDSAGVSSVPSTGSGSQEVAP